MFLLIQKQSKDQKMIEEAFKFHYVSINSSGRSTPYVY